MKLPEISNDAATIAGGSDRYPATIIGNDGKALVLRLDHEVVVKGSEHDGSAEYEYFSNPYGRLNYFLRDRNGRWREAYKNPQTGRWNMSGMARLTIGRRSKYYDPHF